MQETQPTTRLLLWRKWGWMEKSMVSSFLLLFSFWIICWFSDWSRHLGPCSVMVVWANEKSMPPFLIVKNPMFCFWSACHFFVTFHFFLSSIKLQNLYSWIQSYISLQMYVHINVDDWTVTLCKLCKTVRIPMRWCTVKCL